MPRPLRTPVRVLTLLGLALTVTPLHAATDPRDDVIAQLQAQIAALNERLARVEARGVVAEEDYGAAAAARPGPTASAPSDWYDRIELKGDFRLRHEIVDAEDSPTIDRDRIRARLELATAVSEHVDVGMGLATGNGDPVSANQSLGDGDSYKPINLDLAYATWETPVEGVSLTGGKFKNPVHRAGGNGLLWDSDLRPEGGAVTYEHGALFANALGVWIEQNSDGNNTLMWGGQAGWRGDLAATSLLLGVGYFDYDTQGDPVAYDGDPRGNSVDANGDYLFDYKELELFAELSFDLLERPVTLYADYVHNTDADEFDTGYALGATVTFDHPRHDWALAYTWQDLDADAAFALFTDSDFIGGGTDGKGHILRGSYALTPAISVGGTIFINERGGNVGSSQDYDRYQLDLSFKY